MSQASALLQRLDDRRRALLDSLESLSPEALRARPAEGAWSSLEILEHLVVAEQVILQGLPDPATLIDRPRSLRQRCLFPLVVPTGGATLAELRERWDATHAWLRAYAEGLPPGGGGKAIFAHPVCGPITLSQALRLDRLHLEVHTRQIWKRSRSSA